MVRTILVAVALCVIFSSFGEAQVQQSLNLMPVPARMQMGSGQLLIGPTFSVSIAGPHEARLDRAVEIFLAQLGRQIGMPPIDMQVTDSANATLVIQAAGGTKEVQELGEDESYRLEISHAGARLSAPNDARRHARAADFSATGRKPRARVSPCPQFPSKTARAFPGVD